MKEREVIIITSFIICVLATICSKVSLLMVGLSAAAGSVSVSVIFLTIAFVSWIISFSFSVSELIQRMF